MFVVLGLTLLSGKEKMVRTWTSTAAEAVIKDEDRDGGKV